MVYVSKKTKKVEMPEERLFREIEAFLNQIMFSVAIPKVGKPRDLFVKPNVKVNAKYYCNVLLKRMITEMDRLAKHNEYLFMQDRARAHKAKLIIEMLKGKKQLRLAEPHHPSAISPDLIPVEFGICGLLHTKAEE